MERRIVDISRRHLLRGAAGFSLALPFMASLAETSAYGADPTYTRRPRLLWFATDHGGAYEGNMFPASSLLTQSTNLFADHKISSGALKATRTGDRAAISPILSAKGSVLTDKLVGKMNVLMGLDVPFYIAHNTGMHLGNFAANDGNGEGADVQKFPRPTIDQIMAWSPSFYPDVIRIKQRAMLVSSSRSLSWNWSDPSSKSGNIQNVRGSDSSKSLFNSIFVPAMATPSAAPKRMPIADRVLESYKALRDGNRRLSAADKQRLTDHMERMAELDRRLGTSTSTASCSSVAQPTDEASQHTRIDPADATKRWQLFSDVVVAGFLCGTSRIGVAGVGGTDKLAGYQGDWHQDVAHQWQNADKQAILDNSYQRFFETVFLDAATKLDVEEAPGVTYLDNTLMVWSQESGMSTHDSVTIPVVTMGSAAGFFKTGVFADYRRLGNASSKYDPGAGNVQYLGLLYNQFLANVLLSMGVPTAEFERWGHKGYGYPFLTRETWTPPYAKHYQNTSSRYFTMASDVLPFLKA